MSNVYLAENPIEKVTDVNNDANADWENWDLRRYAFGLDTETVPQPLSVNTQINSAGTVMVGGADTSKMRWGYHVFEGYAKDNASRITMLVNKHTEEERDLAELYYYLTAYNHSNKAYGWFKIGSDVKQHSFMFGRDKAIAFGEWDLRNLMTLARISPSNDLDSTYEDIASADSAYEAESKYSENAKCVLYLALKNAKNGAVFYDTDREKPVIKVNGKWCELSYSEITDGTYDNFNDISIVMPDYDATTYQYYALLYDDTVDTNYKYTLIISNNKITYFELSNEQYNARFDSKTNTVRYLSGDGKEWTLDNELSGVTAIQTKHKIVNVQKANYSIDKYYTE